jgi:hypothetical protein
MSRNQFPVARKTAVSLYQKRGLRQPINSMKTITFERSGCRTKEIYEELNFIGFKRPLVGLGTVSRRTQNRAVKYGLGLKAALLCIPHARYL